MCLWKVESISINKGALPNLFLNWRTMNVSQNKCWEGFTTKSVYTAAFWKVKNSAGWDWPNYYQRLQNISIANLVCALSGWRKVIGHQGALRKLHLVHISRLSTWKNSSWSTFTKLNPHYLAFLFVLWWIHW